MRFSKIDERSVSKLGFAVIEALEEVRQPADKVVTVQFSDPEPGSLPEFGDEVENRRRSAAQKVEGLGQDR